MPFESNLFISDVHDIAHILNIHHHYLVSNMLTQQVAKPVVKKQPPLPIGVGRVPKWWMDLTPHDRLDLAEHEAQTKIQEQMSHYYLKLAAAGLVGQDGHLVTLPDGQPDWSRIQEQRIRLNPKLFGVADKDPDFHFYETGELLPQEFKLKMQEMYGSITPNQLEYKKYGATKDDNKPTWVKMKLKHSKEGDMIRSGVDIDEGPNGYSRRFGGTSDFSEKPAVMIVGGKRLVRKVRRVPKKKNGPSSDKPAPTQIQQHDQHSPQRISKVAKGTTEPRKPVETAPPANGRHPPSPRRDPSAAQRRISPPPTQKPSSKAPKGQQSQSPQKNYSGTNVFRSSYSADPRAVTEQQSRLMRQGNKQPVLPQSPPSRKQALARTPSPSRIKQRDDQSQAETPVTTNNKHVHSERLMSNPLLNGPPSIKVTSYQPITQGTHFQDARACLKKTPTKPSSSGVAPSWRQTHVHTSHDYPQAPPVAVQRGPSQGGSRGTHKLIFLADEDDSEPAMISPALGEQYEEEEYEEVVDEYYDADYNEGAQGENLYYDEEEEVLSIHEVFVDEQTVEEGDGSSYYEEEVTDDSGEIEYYEEEEEEAINELQARLAAKQAQLARLR